MKHGSEYAYRRRRCRCDECKLYNRRRVADARIRRHKMLTENPDLVIHGTGTAYDNWGCRCALCVAAYTRLRYVRLSAIPWKTTENE